MQPDILAGDTLALARGKPLVGGIDNGVELNQPLSFQLGGFRRAGDGNADA
jgi:hypothetical protein